jgi:dinuclear metal center YbgI/SA1388 family protein
MGVIQIPSLPTASVPLLTSRSNIFTHIPFANMTNKSTIADVANYLNELAPTAYQENYDNAGLLTGNPTWEVKAALITLDCTEPVVEEAIDLGCNLIVAHHPILFKPIKKITSSNYVERTLIKAIKNDIAIYASHTNLDHVHHGVNSRIAKKLGLVNSKILLPKRETLVKLVTFSPRANTAAVLEALHRAGAGQIGEYKNCSFTVAGTGAFSPTEKANPYLGTAGTPEKVEEDRLEVILPKYLERPIIQALKSAHPYEEVAYYLTELINENQDVGAGMVGDLPEEASALDFLKKIKTGMKSGCLRHTALCHPKIKRVAVCGGAGSFLVREAKRAGAQVFVSSDFKYHEFFDAENEIILADIGHYESEQFTKDLLRDVLHQKFVNFASIFSKTITNPISYL